MKLTNQTLINLLIFPNQFEYRYLDVGKLKIVPVDLKKLSYVVDNEVVKNTTFNTLKTKVNALEKKS